MPCQVNLRQVLWKKGGDHFIIRISMVFIITMANGRAAVCDQDYFARFCPADSDHISGVLTLLHTVCIIRSTLYSDLTWGVLTLVHTVSIVR